jgi:N-acetylneuraminate epimerase
MCKKSASSVTGQTEESLILSSRYLNLTLGNNLLRETMMTGRVQLLLFVVLCGNYGGDLHAQSPKAAASLKWTELNPLPDPVGFAGPFVGVAGDALIVAGGANFPEKAPWEGGTKVWHDSVFVLTDPDGDWKTGFRLPRPAAYGITVSLSDGMVCIGGGDSKRHFDDVTRLAWNGEEVTHQSFPPLPCPLAFMTGVLHQDTVYVFGGIEKPESTLASHALFALKLGSPSAKPLEWETLPPCPGPGRILGQAASLDDHILIAGGAKLVADSNGQATREFLTDAWLFDPSSQSWKAAADLPRSILAAPNPGMRINGGAAFLSGDDGRFFGQSLEFKHPGFPADLFLFEQEANRWTRTTPFPKSVPSDTGPRHNAGRWPPVTTGGVDWRGRFVIASGEIRPGLRSPRVFSVTVE